MKTIYAMNTDNIRVRFRDFMDSDLDDWEILHLPEELEYPVAVYPLDPSNICTYDPVFVDQFVRYMGEISFRIWKW